MNKIRIVKLATSAITGAGASHIVDGIVKSNVNLDDLNSFGKVQVAAARVVIGLIAASKTKEYTDARIDEIVVAWHEVNTTTDPAPTA